jgi:serine/threonine protein kinase
MEKIDKAVLSSSGEEILFVATDDAPRGSMKYTFFTLDKSMVVQFFNDKSSIEGNFVKERLNRIIHKYNPTVAEEDGGARGNTPQTAEYFRKRFCWPLDTVYHRKYGLGIVSPSYPKNFFFDEYSSKVQGMNLNGKDKNSRWFTGKSRKYLRTSELGDFRSMLQICVLLSRTIRRLHQAGLAHSDLSCKNVLIDPKTGTCVVIDVDSLVVPNVYPPEVMGTRGYIAPEVIATSLLDDDLRVFPSIKTDLHSLAVLIYEYLLCRHPLLDGPKIYDCTSAENDDFLALGEQATFIENPTDFSNHPNDLRVTIKDLGEELERLFLKSFVDGLHNPNLRPTALEWEQGLSKTWDMLHSCSNPNCDKKWFVIRDVNRPVCPFCGARVMESIVKIDFLIEKQTDKGKWYKISSMVAENHTPIMKWHLSTKVFPDERADRTIMAYTYYYDNRWVLVNNACEGMHSPNGNLLPRGKATVITDGCQVRLDSYNLVMRFDIR